MNTCVETLPLNDSQHGVLSTAPARLAPAQPPNRQKLTVVLQRAVGVVAAVQDSVPIEFDALARQVLQGQEGAGECGQQVHPRGDAKQRAQPGIGPAAAAQCKSDSGVPGE